MRIAGASILLLSSVLAVVACSEDDDTLPPPSGGSGGEAGSGGSSGGGGADTGGAGPGVSGALIRVTAVSQVGVLLDEIPEEMRERVADAVLEKPAAFFVDRAKRQLTLATYKLNFRAYFYDEEDEKMQLPLPPEEVLEIELIPDEDGALVRRATVEGHDYVLADYRLDALVVTDAESPGISEPALAEIGGTWDEPFVFPVDPELLIQRTGYACMDEAQFPPNSVDSEDPEFFYDQTCEVEEELTPDGCHYTELPDESCEEALTNRVGKVVFDLHFERMAWDAELAESARVGAVESQGVADLDVVGEELAVNRLTYRYIEETSCALVEACVGGAGWRRLLQFNASEKNVGSEPIHIGDIDYFIDDPENPTANEDHHVYVYSACHNHYHFNYFARFTYGGDPNLGSKRAFCLESVARYGNHEQSPTWSPYSDCAYQGISAGWGDQYNAGIECQWVDVTTIDTSEGPVSEPLGLRSNPEGFLCEGTPELDEDGNPVWEETDLTTEHGEPVDRPACDETDGWEENNYDELAITLPLPGEGMITEPCTRGQIGPLRNCGFAYDGALVECEPGEEINVTCSAEAGASPQTVRLCEGSHSLGAGVACVDRDALATVSLLDEAPQTTTITCPSARDATETGGRFAVYRGAIWPEDATAEVLCSVD